MLLESALACLEVQHLFQQEAGFFLEVGSAASLLGLEGGVAFEDGHHASQQQAG